MNLIASRTLVLAATAAILVGCGSKQNNTVDQKKSTPKVSCIDAMVGNYVSDGYNQKDQGADWVAVTVTKINDSIAHIRIRSRIDQKKATCTFDADAILKDSISLSSSKDGAEVLYSFNDKGLTISSITEEGKNKLMYFCSGGGSIAGVYTKLAGELDKTTIDPADYRQTLSMGKYIFDIESTNGQLSVQPIGFDKDNTKITQSIEGEITNAEIGDLNIDGFPELMIYTRTKDANHMGTVIGFSSNKGLSVSQISIPSIKDKAEASKGYNGNDEFAIVESGFSQRFPIVDAKNQPTGKMRQIQYKLKDGEASRILVVDKVIEF